MPAKLYKLSKSSFLKFEQCEKAYFFHATMPYLRDKLDVDTELTFRRGHDVGFFARTLFPGGTDVSANNATIEQALEQTASLLASGADTIYEATFIHNGVLVMVDILKRTDNKFQAYEIKSSLKVSETYLKDAYLQFYVLSHALEGFEDLHLVTLNGEYTRRGDIDVRQLFKKRSVAAMAKTNFGYFENRIHRAEEVLEQNVIPDIPVGPHCYKPYQCDYFGTCWKGMFHEQSIFNMPLVSRSTVFEWHQSGAREIADIQDHQLHKEALRRIRNAIANQTRFVDREGIRNFLASSATRQAALDMEVWGPAIPQLEGTSPFEQIPFLFCINDGESEKHFYTIHEKDDRRAFAEALIAETSSYDLLLIYDRSLESGVIKQLMAKFPDLQPALRQILDKMRDVFEVILDVMIYDPRFQGNFTLKTVSSVLLGKDFYSDIHSGLEAMYLYDVCRTTENPLEREVAGQRLIDYCNADAKATYDVAQFLKAL